jgi:hypothetical protein
MNTFMSISQIDRLPRVATTRRRMLKMLDLKCFDGQLNDDKKCVNVRELNFSPLLFEIAGVMNASELIYCRDKCRVLYLRVEMSATWESDFYLLFVFSIATYGELCRMEYCWREQSKVIHKMLKLWIVGWWKWWIWGLRDQIVTQ